MIITSMPIASLALAIFFEIIGSSLLKLSDGFDKTHWGIIAIFAYAVAFYFFSHSVKVIPLGIAYALWSGIGIIATTLIGYFAFRQHLDLWAVAGISLMILGVALITLKSSVNLG